MPHILLTRILVFRKKNNDFWITCRVKRLTKKVLAGIWNDDACRHSCWIANFLVLGITQSKWMPHIVLTSILVFRKKINDFWFTCGVQRLKSRTNNISNGKTRRVNFIPPPVNQPSFGCLKVKNKNKSYSKKGHWHTTIKHKYMACGS